MKADLCVALVVGVTVIAPGDFAHATFCCEVARAPGSTVTLRMRPEMSAPRIAEIPSGADFCPLTLEDDDGPADWDYGAYLPPGAERALTGWLPESAIVPESCG